MNGTIGLASRLLRAVAVTLAAPVALVALAILWRQRPAIPELPASMSSPVTTALIQELVLVAAWFLSGLVVLLVLAHSIFALTEGRPRQASARYRSLVLERRDGTAMGSRSVRRRPGFPPPFSLVPRGATRPRPDSDTSPHAPTDTPERRDRAAVSIALLGPVRISPSKRRGRGLRAKTQEFLAYLALRREGATTDELAAVLWPDVDDETAKRRVWRSASEARSQLGDVVLHVGDRYLLDRRTVEVDLDEFNALLAESAVERDGVREQLLERAGSLVRGEPLASTDYAWAAGDVRHVRGAAAGLFQQLGELRLSGDPGAALACAEQAIALDPYAESAQRLAMRAEAALGLREAIVERYEGVRRELTEKLGLEPERETRLLYRHLLSQDAQAANRAAGAA